MFPSRFADCVLKSFVAEGAVYNHNIFVASGREPCEEYLVNELPSLITSKQHSDNENRDRESAGGGDGTNPMKIAWRYGHQQGSGPKEIVKFDFSKKSSASDLGAKHVTISQLLQQEESLDDVADKDLLQEIYAVVQSFKLPSAMVNLSSTSSATVEEKFPSNLVRISLSHCEAQSLSPKFMMGLRAIVRHTNSCALLTISDTAATVGCKIGRAEHFADYVISLQAVTDEKRRTDLGDIDGICDIIKIASVNSLKPVDLPRDLGFSFKRKRLVFHVRICFYFIMKYLM